MFESNFKYLHSLCTGKNVLIFKEKNLFFFLIDSLLVTEHEKELRDKYLKSGSKKIGKNSDLLTYSCTNPLAF